LGGQLLLGSTSKYKKELGGLIDFQKRQVEKYGVHCHLNFEVSIDTIKNEMPDVVILATGSVPIIPSIKGIDSPIVQTLPQPFKGDISGLKKVIVIGGGATGCEMALYLAEKGCSVTIVEKLPKIGIHIESVTRKVVLQKLQENNIRTLTGSQPSRIVENGVFVTKDEGEELFLEGQRVIIAIGNKPDNSLSDQIKSLGMTMYQIGDCLEPRSAKAAIHEGAKIGRAI